MYKSLTEIEIGVPKISWQKKTLKIVLPFQSDKEKQSGLPVQKHMDRDHVTKPSAQIGFISYILLPMFKSLAKVQIQLSDRGIVISDLLVN